MPIPLTVRAADPVSLETPLLIIPAQASESLPESLTAIDLASGGCIASAWQSRDFTGLSDQAVLVYCTGPARRVLLVGLGGPEDVDHIALRRAAMVGGKRARMLGVDHAAFLVPSPDLDPRTIGRVVAEALPFGAWHYPGYRGATHESSGELVGIDVVMGEAASMFSEGIELGTAIAHGQELARELQVLPADTCTPDYLAERARELAGRHQMAITVLDRSGLEAEGMRAILAVGQGSVNEPRFVAIEYRGAGDADPIVLIGKGVTFDAGGISIKPALNMEDMKYDMSGAAAVLGTMEVIGRLGPKCNVIGLVPSAENMVSGASYRPGDVIRTHLGKTIEVVNTDAEGRLLLADALSWAHRYRPAAVIDCATLTGAAVIGLGHSASAVMGTDQDLVAELIRAGEATGERLWQLPLWDDYRKLIKSDIADMKNSGGRPAGTITAACLLREFAEGLPWSHIDIAGTAYTPDEPPTAVKGPTGVLVRLFSEYVLQRS